MQSSLLRDSRELFWRGRAHPGPIGAVGGLRRSTPWAALMVIAPLSTVSGVELDQAKLPPPASQKIDFVRDIHPILLNHCLKCHSDEKPRSHFRLTSRETALQGGDNGVDIVLGHSANSPLIGYVARIDEDVAMPPAGRGTPLDAREVGLLRAWIDQGVVWEPTLQQPPTELSAVLVAGGTGVHGNAAKFRELYWQRDGGNGGLEEFAMVERPSAGSRIEATGRVLLDDYKINLFAEKTDLGFAQFGWSQFRKYYNNTGGYYPLFTPSSFSLDRDLHMNIGKAWTEVGLTLPRWPRIILGYEYQYRDGTESTLHWGSVSNHLVEARDIYPAFENVAEKVHVIKLEVDYQLAGVDLNDKFRGEWYRLATRSFNESGFTLGNPTMALTTGNEVTRHFQGANTFHAEKQLTDWWLASGGYLYSRLSGDGAVDVETINPAALDPALGAPGWNSQTIQLESESHVFSISSLLGPWQGLSLSLGTQNEWTRQAGFTIASVNFALPSFPYIFPQNEPETLYSDLDRSIFSQDLGVRFTTIPFTTLFADVRFQQDTTGLYEQQINGLSPDFLRKTDIKSDLKDFRLGFNTSPWRRWSLSGDYRKYDKETDYDNIVRVIPQDPLGYPAFIRWRDLRSEEAQAKLSVQWAAWLKTALTYQWLQNHYRTATEPVGDPPPNGGSLLAGTYVAQNASLNATLTPWRRWFFSSTFSFQHAQTHTDDNGSTAVAPYIGDIYSVLLNGTFAVSAKTDLAAGYAFSTADFGQVDAADGLPLGIHYHQHSLQAGIRHQIAKGKSVGLQYRYYRYVESSTGDINNLEAHALFATLAWRLP
jgi:hypothetical protein